MMADDTPPESTTHLPHMGFWSRHPKLAILLIAAVFYLILIAMCAVVVMILWQQG
jgi:hypothetical protein